MSPGLVEEKSKMTLIYTNYSFLGSPPVPLSGRFLVFILAGNARARIYMILCRLVATTLKTSTVCTQADRIV